MIRWDILPKNGLRGRDETTLLKQPIKLHVLFGYHNGLRFNYHFNSSQVFVSVVYKPWVLHLLTILKSPQELANSMAISAILIKSSLVSYYARIKRSLVNPWCLRYAMNRGLPERLTWTLTIQTGTYGLPLIWSWNHFPKAPKSNYIPHSYIVAPISEPSVIVCFLQVKVSLNATVEKLRRSPPYVSWIFWYTGLSSFIYQL